MDDKETNKILSEQEELALGIKGNFWGIVKNKILEKTTLLDSVSNYIFEGKTNEQIAGDLKAMANTVEVLNGIIREVEGDVEMEEPLKEWIKPSERLVRDFRQED